MAKNTPRFPPARLNKPPLAAGTSEYIARQQYQIDLTYLASLRALRVSFVEALQRRFQGQPFPPPQPVRVCRTLADYGMHLFDVEAREYPRDPDLRSQLENLAERIERKVLSVVVDSNLLFGGDLRNHADPDEMRVAVRQALEERIRLHLSRAETTAPAKAVEDKSRTPKSERPHPKPAPAPSIAASMPEPIQVNNTAAVYVFAQEARRAKKRKRKLARRRVKEPVAAEPAVDKATTETGSANEAAPPIALERPTKGRHADVESFRNRILAAEGYEPTKKDIRIVVGRSKDPRSFEYFQYNIAKASKPAIEAYDADLKIEPTEFMRKLRQLKPESKPKRKSRR